MKVLFYVGYPLAWARGGHAVQILESQKHLERSGVEISWIHHECDPLPKADIIHYWTRPPSDFHWRLAKQQGLKLVISEIHAGVANMSARQWWIRKHMARLMPYVIGKELYSNFGLNVYPHCDAAIALNSLEAEYMKQVMKAPSSNVHVIPNGVDDVFLESGDNSETFDGLIYLAYITERKNQVAAAKAAKQAQVPIKFIGDPAFDNDSYVAQFEEEVDGQYVFWEKGITDPSAICAKLKGAYGMVLASQSEGLPLVMLESLACGTPVMSVRLKNIEAYFQNAIRYCHPVDNDAFNDELKTFYEDCQAGLVQTFHVDGWMDIAKQIKQVYETICF